MQDAQNSLQDSQGEMAGAQDPGDIPDGDSGKGKGAGQQAGPGPRAGPAGDGAAGVRRARATAVAAAGRGKPNTTYHKGQKPNGQNPQKPGFGADAPHWLNPNFDPSKNPRYAKLYFGKPKTAGPSQAGPTRKTRPGENDGPVTQRRPVLQLSRHRPQDRRKRDGPGGHPARLQEKRLGLLQLPPAPNPAAPGGQWGRGRKAVELRPHRLCLFKEPYANRNQ